MILSDFNAGLFPINTEIPSKIPPSFVITTSSGVPVGLPTVHHPPEVLSSGVNRHFGDALPVVVVVVLLVVVLLVVVAKKISIPL